MLFEQLASFPSGNPNPLLLLDGWSTLKILLCSDN
jgi:hypothetical protein